tara:strand:+ start:15324 stop:16487 length:1164 start_codon:yes stop_codon:yes gene_type:complete
MNGMNQQLMAQAGPLQSAIAELEQDFERENAELDRQEQLLREEQEFARQQREQDMQDELAARQEARRAERGQDMADDDFRQSVQTAPKREQALYGEGTFQPRHAGGVVHRTEYPGEAPEARERRLERTERRVYGPDSLEAEARGLGYGGVSDFVRGPGGVSEDIDAALGAAPEGDDEVQAAIDAGREARTARERAAQTARRGRETSQYGRGLRRRRPRQDTPYHEREYRGLDRYLTPGARPRGGPVSGGGGGGTGGGDAPSTSEASVDGQQAASAPESGSTAIRRHPADELRNAPERLKAQEERAREQAERSQNALRAARARQRLGAKDFDVGAEAEARRLQRDRETQRLVEESVPEKERRGREHDQRVREERARAAATRRSLGSYR